MAALQMHDANQASSYLSTVARFLVIEDDAFVTRPFRLYSNKQGAIRMHLGPRTFESHCPRSMRKLGFRNTADPVRSALAEVG